MRNRRGVLGGAILVAAMAVLLTLTAAISSATVTPPSTALLAAPTAPYSVLILDGVPGKYPVGGNRVVEPVSGYSNGEYVSISGGAVGHDWGFIAMPPTGSIWTAGTTYSMKGAPATATTGWVSVGGEGRGCNQQEGTLTVREVARNGTFVSVFAASFVLGCETPTPTVTGEVRWNSTIDYAAASIDPVFSISFPNQVPNTTSTPKTVTLTGRGSLPITFGTAVIEGQAPDGFAIADDACSGVTLTYGQTCTLSVLAHPSLYQSYSALLTIPDDTPGGRKGFPVYVTGVPAATTPAPTTPQPTITPTVPPTTTPPDPNANVGTFYQLAPARILDTRYGNGAAQHPLGQDSTMSLQVNGRGGVPASGVSAVVLNVTTTGATGDSYLTVYPSAVTRPTASSLNFVRGWTGANSVTVGVGTNGRVDIYNHVGSTEVIADVVGFYAADSSMVAGLGAGGQYQPVLPERLFDSRADWATKLPAGYSVRVPVSYGPDLDPHIRALVVNVTAVDAAGPGYLSTWDGTNAPPATSTLNYTSGATVANLAVVPVSWCTECGGVPSIGVYTHADTHVIVDILGVFDDGTVADGLRFKPRTPVRIADTRSGQGASGALTGGTTATITAPSDVAAVDTLALALNVTAVSPTSSTFLTVWPAGISGLGMPTASNLNPAPGQTVPNAVYTLVGPTKAVNVYSNSGVTHVVIDVVGTFYLNPATATAVASSGRSSTVTRKPLAIIPNRGHTLLGHFG